MADLLLEIGTEEIPASYIRPALDALSAHIVLKLDQSRIHHGPAQVYGTPRRLAVQVADVAPRQTSLTEAVLGPPERVALDETGKPTVAALKFAGKMGIPASRLTVVDTEKGRYCCAGIKRRGLAATTILKEILPQAILAVPFPKSMRWADLSISFARPIRSILALWGDRLISFLLDGRIRSGRYVFGHYFMHSGKIKIPDTAAYLPLLREAKVIADMKARQQAAMDQIHGAAAQLGGMVLPDDELMEIVTHLVECPFAVSGRFDPAYLELPGEILITAMREHQKYFAVTDHSGRLMPCFIALNNTRTKDMPLVAAGHERVLQARLSDARFFYECDIKMPMDRWVEKLKGVLFQADLGSMYDKMERIAAVADHLSKSLRPGLKSDVAGAARLCKADLVSQVVGEFPKLQGVMGRIYAALAGENETVAGAIEEHYRPVSAGAALPESDAGAILAIADKIDTLCGFFSIGMIPTGASDPYALRRQGIGIVNIILEKNFSISLHDLIRFAVARFSGVMNAEPRAVADKIYGFLRNRISHMLAEQQFSKEVIAAVVEQSVDHIPEVWQRVRALEKMRSKPDFEMLAAAFKRVMNIVKKSESAADKTIDARRFEHPSESALYDAFKSVEARVRQDMEAGAFDAVLLRLASLRGVVDDFFIGVKVMADDPEQRENRLALLSGVASLFDDFADFSKISV